MKSEYYLDLWCQCHNFVSNFKLSQFKWVSGLSIPGKPQFFFKQLLDLIHDKFVESKKLNRLQ